MLWYCLMRVLLILFTVVGLIGCVDRPVTELETARQALSRAISEEAPELVPLIYSRAEGALQAAEQELDAQNTRWFWERNYSTALELLNWATNDAHRAAHDAIEMKHGHQNQVGYLRLGPLNSVPVGNGLDQNHTTCGLSVGADHRCQKPPAWLL